MDRDVRAPLRLLLGAQPEDELEWLAAQTRLQAYPPGFAVSLEGQPPSDMFLLLEGRLRLTKLRADMRQACIAYLQPLALVGHVALLMGTACPTTMAAVEPSLCLRIPGRLLRPGTDPRSRGPALRLLQASVRGMNVQLRTVNAHLLRMDGREDAVGELARDLGAWSLPDEP
jgi:CRP-like cAMP-binding protein